MVFSRMWPKPFFIFCFLTSNLFAYHLPLPTSLRGKPVYYEHADQIDWSCGYNVLYNACRMEKKLKFKQPYAELHVFKMACLPYIRRCGKEPQEASTNKMLIDLADILKMQPFSYLGFDSRNQNEIMYNPGKIYYTCPHGASQSEREWYAQKAVKQAHTDRMKFLYEHFYSYHPQAIIHFACHVNPQGEEHVILLSVMRDGDKVKIYIFDNMNASIDEYSQAMRYIKLIMKEFRIGSATVERPGKPNLVQRVVRSKAVHDIARGLGLGLRHNLFYK